MNVGTRVALLSAVGTWRPGSVGTVVATAGPGLGRFDVIVELDAGGRLFFLCEELRTLELASSGAPSSPR